MACRECGAALLVHDGVGSLVCTSCGTLADPAQATLADSDDHPAAVSYAAPRTSKGWRLVHTKQDRDRKNMIAMSTFINSVLSRLNNPGLSPRAEAMFAQAMTKGHYRWGRKAKLAAGASISIALREARKSDSLRDIALLLDDSAVSLARTFQSVVSLLDLSLVSTDSAVHLPTLHAHLHAAVHPETLSPAAPSRLPKALILVLASLSLQTAVRTATSLSQVILRHSPPLALVGLPTPPTACALLILGLEAEARAPLPHLGELARTLGTRFALSPGVVSSRYRAIYDLVEEWIRHVPWLDQFVYKGKGRGPAARSKVAKRVIIAKGIKDVIQFHEEIWLSRTQNLQKIELELDPDPHDSASDVEGDSQSANAPPHTDIDGCVVAPPLAKRRKIEKKRDAMQAAYQFLLDPLSSRYLDGAKSSGKTSLLTHILTCPSEELSRTQNTPPTRLQLLTASRGGSTAEHITDEELFAVGELEGLLRSEQEREALGSLFQLNWGGEPSTEEATDCQHGQTTNETRRHVERVNMDALVRLLSGKGDDDCGSEEDVFPDADSDVGLWDSGRTTHQSEHQITAEDAELVGDWRPASPDEGGFGDIRGAPGERYEEEL